MAEPSSDAHGGRAVATLAGVHKTFGTVRALDDVSFEVAPGEIHALLGHNGAGKSTVVGVLAGVHGPERGEVRIGGQALRPSPAAALALGVRCIFQHRTLFPNISVAENVAMLDRARFGYSRRRARQLARRRLARLQCSIDIEQDAGELAAGEAQEVDIARGLDDRCRLLILDEPTSSLSAREVERLLEVITQVRALDVGVLFISHDLDICERIADRITVLRDGRIVASGPSAGFSRHDLVGHMLGAGYEDPRAAASGPGQTTGESNGVLRVGLHGVRGHRLQPVSVKLHAGEVTAITGALGSGFEEFARLLAGVHRPTAGFIELDGRRVELRSPRQALRAGIAYVPDDRAKQGVFAQLLPTRQIWLSRIVLSRNPIIRLSRERRQAVAAGTAVGIRRQDLERPAWTLSGGNQQKIMLARCLAVEPRVLVAQEPTAGVDVGSRASVHELLRETAGNGAAVVLVTSDAKEVEEVADRVIVVRRGHIALDTRTFNEGLVVAESIGHRENGSD
jgi:rhamnose transport system ATP-binding protein